MYETNLKNLRNHLAAKKGIPAYIIFPDEQLELLLQAKPKTLKELSELKGFPLEGKRLENWGNAIVQIFRTTTKVEFESDSTERVRLVFGKVSLV